MSHDELLDTVWQGTFVEQSNLKKGISALRQLLEESPEDGLYIKTIPRQGYAFVAAVRELPDEESRILRRTQTEIVIEETIETRDDEPKTLAAAKGTRRPFLLSLIAVILLSCIGFAAWKFIPRSQFRYSVETTKIQKLTSDGNCAGRISPDENFVLCSIREGNVGSALEVVQIETGVRRRLVSYPDGVFYATRYSPDGNFVYYLFDDRSDPEKSGLYKLSVNGGEPRRIMTNVGAVTVAANGTLALTRGKKEGGVEIVTAGPNGEDPNVAIELPDTVRIWDFRFSPDDEHLLVSVRKQLSSDKIVFYVFERSLKDGSERVVVPERDTLISSALWMPGGESLILAIRETNADIRQIWQYFPATGAMQRITNDNNSYFDIVLLKDGKTIGSLITNIQTNLWISDAYAGDERPLNFRQATRGAQILSDVFWMPDGRLGHAAVENGSEIVRIMSSDGKSSERITDGKDGIWIQPSLSYDGSAIAFNSNRSGLTQLWRIDPSGQGLSQLTFSETPLFHGKLLSGGVVVYFTLDPKLGWMLIKQTPDKQTSRLTESDGDAWAISPDERMIAFFTTDPKTKQRHILIESLENATEKRTIPLPVNSSIRQLKFTRDSKNVTYDLNESGASEIYLQPIAGGPPRKLSNFGSDTIFSLDWSFDNSRLAVSRGRSFTDTILIRSEPAK